VSYTTNFDLKCLSSNSCKELSHEWAIYNNETGSNIFTAVSFSGIHIPNFFAIFACIASFFIPGNIAIITFKANVEANSFQTHYFWVNREDFKKKVHSIWVKDTWHAQFGWAFSTLTEVDKTKEAANIPSAPSPDKLKAD
jgi:hypothetical protein